MIFGDQKYFAIECLMLKGDHDYNLIRTRIIFKKIHIGNFEELAVSGTIILAITSFLKFGDHQVGEFQSEEEMYKKIYSEMYGDKWKIGLMENFRDKFSLHDIFELSIADEGHIMLLVRLPSGKSKVLLGDRSGKYNEYIDLPTGYVEKILGEIQIWIEKESQKLRFDSAM
ncbi:hypothetical protein [Paracidovorax sp. MALMAid1276]|uniref:hypothetical protein n=1 Tax=Paracidovorax sp. MALMAid1276 TaxID=3411631 RepID=UPI003B9C7588